MRPGNKPAFASAVVGKLGLFCLIAILPLALLACASSPKQSTLPSLESRLEPVVKTPPPAPAPSVVKTTPPPADRSASPSEAPVETDKHLQTLAKVSEEELQEMRGCLGVYYFDFTFDINMQTSPQVSVSSKFTAAVPEGTSPSFNGTTAVFKDNNVFYMAGPTQGGLMSEVIVTGRDNFVIANTQFNIHIPNAAFISPTINVLPAASLTGLGPK